MKIMVLSKKGILQENSLINNLTPSPGFPSGRASGIIVLDSSVVTKILLQLLMIIPFFAWIIF